MVIRYTHLQLDLIEQAHPDVDLGNLVEVSFEFDRRRGDDRLQFPPESNSRRFYNTATRQWETVR